MAKEYVTREELYEQVWTTPLLRLAVQYGVSNVALAKTCRRLNVPTPNRGYWARVAAGEKLKRPPLPKAAGHQATERLVRDPAASLTEVKAESLDVTVGQSLATAHDVVRKVAGLLQRASVDADGQLRVSGVLVVTVEAHRRALLILDALCKGLQARGHAVSIVRDEEGVQALQAAIGIDTVSFSMSERHDPVEHVLSRDEQERMTRGDTRNIPKYDYHPSGRLCVSVHEHRLTQQSWADTKKRALDRVLGRVVMSIEAVAASRRAEREAVEQKRLAEEERKRVEAEERANARRRQKLAEYQELLGSDLEAMAGAWMAARRLHEFLTAWEARVPAEERDDVARDWLERARAHAEKLDPLPNAKALPLPFEPADDALDDLVLSLKARAPRP
jgi:hypothetical protein